MLPSRPKLSLIDPQSMALPNEPHRVVAAWLESDRQAAELARKEKRPPPIKGEDTVMGRRMLRICDALFKAAEIKGYSLNYQRDDLLTVWFEIAGRSVQWSLREQTSPCRVSLSKAELRKPSNIATGITTKEIRVPTATFKLFASTDFAKKLQISERKDRPFEQRAEEILARLEALAVAANMHEVKLAQWDQDYEREKRDKERVRRLDAIEAARWDYLRELNTDWQEARALRSFIDAVERELDDGGRSQRTTAWLKWARDRADWLDPLSEGSTAASDITRWRYAPSRSEYELTIWDLA